MMSAMEIRHELRYDVAPERVYAMLTDPAFRHRVCDAMRVVSRDISIEQEGDVVLVRVDMLQASAGVPGFARKVVGEQTRILQTESWTGGRTADLRVEIPGRPGRVAGRTTLSGVGSGTAEYFEGEARISVPFIGGQLERLIQGLFIRGMETERQVGVEWLKAAG
jgi:hypothetical protein